MISEELLAILRCPVNPIEDAVLEVEKDALVCSPCKLRFKIKDGFPSMVKEEAELPEGCESLEDLPCQK